MYVFWSASCLETLYISKIGDSMKKTSIFKSLILSFIAMSLITSCGGSNSSAGSASSSSSPVTQNGLTSVSADSFVGSWTGYLDDSYTAITIAANGSITITSVGQSTRTRILFLQNSIYYIVNTETKTGVPVKVSGSSLIVTINGVNETFSKN
jgi:hypothetical protein